MRKIAGDYLDAFGYWRGQLHIADRHHADILARLIEKGASWEELLSDPPVFGWLQHTDTPDWEDHEENWDGSWENIQKVPRNKQNPITVKFNTDTGAPPPDETQQQQVLKAISKYYKAPAVEGNIDWDLWEVGTDEDMGVDSSEYNLEIQGLQKQVNDLKKSNSAPTKWMWSPHYNRYQEWGGEMSHPEVAMDIWGLTGDEFQHVWGGVHHPDGSNQFGWWPTDLGSDPNKAKRNTPIALLQHFQKRQVNNESGIV